MELHQVLVSASPGDAITNAALFLQQRLRQIGPSEIFAHHIHPDLGTQIRPLIHYRRLPSAKAGTNVLIVHASIGSDEVMTFLAGRPEALVLDYHNVTPSRFFAAHDPAFAELLDKGRAQIASLRRRVILAVAASAYNASDLEELGYRDVRVSAPPVDLQSLCQQHGDDEIDQRLARLDGPMVLFVGQLLPHKRPDLLIQSFHVLVTYLRPDARLVLVGASPVASYVRLLNRLVFQLGLDRVHLTGRVSDAELAAYYRRSSMFATMSEHEGFCIPIVEAMAFERPILARMHGSIPEVAGDAAFLLPPDAGPLLVAEAMAELLANGVLRDALVAKGRERLTLYDPDRSVAELLTHLLDVL